MENKSNGAAQAPLAKKEASQEATEILQGLGEEFLLQRNRLGLRLNKVGEDSGISTNTIGNLEKGKLGNATIESLVKIAATLGLRIRITTETVE